MKNLWRIIMLFMLPGLVLGGNTITAFFRFADGTLEPLAALCAAALTWCTAAYITSKAAFHFFRKTNAYYPGIMIFSVMLAAAPGVALNIFGNGTVAAFTGTVFSGAALAWAVQSFTGKSYSKVDLWCFVAGFFSSIVPWLYGALYSRLAWLETFCFYLAIFMIIAWWAASPLTVYGSKCKKNIWRIILPLTAIGAFFTVPMFSPPPIDPATPAGKDKLWTKTYTTINGRRFILQEKDGRYGYYAPNGRMLFAHKADEPYQAALPLLLSITGEPPEDIQVVAPLTSTLPGTIKDFSAARVKHYRLPEAMFFRKNSWNRQKSTILLSTKSRVGILPEKDLLIITMLPENQYQSFIKKFLQYFTDDLKPNGMAAIPASLLKSPAVFSFMHEKFAFCGVLPAPGDLWIFSNAKIDLSVSSISRNLQKIFGQNHPLAHDMYEVVYNDDALWEKNAPAEPLEKTALGGNTWLGSWWWLPAGLAVAFLWRIIRLLGERRNIMYSCFNAIENGFSGMGVFLLVLSLLLVNTGMPVLFTALAAVTFCFYLSKWQAGGIWFAIAGILLIALATLTEEKLFLIIVMLQASFLTGALPAKAAQDINMERQLQCSVFLGMLLASMAITAVWMLDVPLLLIWAMLLAARVPGIWQYSAKGVYYGKNRR